MIGTFSETTAAIRCLTNRHAWPYLGDASRATHDLTRRLGYLRRRIAEYERDERACIAAQNRGDLSFIRDWLKSDRLEVSRIVEALSPPRARVRVPAKSRTV